MTDPLTLAASERFRDACDDGERDGHPDFAAPRTRTRDFAHLHPWHDAAARWAERRAWRDR